MQGNRYADFLATSIRHGHHQSRILVNPDVVARHPDRQATHYYKHRQVRRDDMERALNSGNAYGGPDYGRVPLVPSARPMTRIAAAQPEKYRRTTPYDLSRLDQATDWIRLHLKDPALNVDSLARALHISRRALYLLFRAHGQTPATVISDLRLASCKEELADLRNKQKLTAIAFDHGFHHVSTFSRLFKARYGVSPDGYRKQYASKRCVNNPSTTSAIELPARLPVSRGNWPGEHWWNLPLLSEAKRCHLDRLHRMQREQAHTRNAHGRTSIKDAPQ